MNPIPLSDIVQLPLPGTQSASRLRFLGPNTLTFLAPAPGSLVQALWSLDLETGERTRRLGAGVKTEEGLSLEERLRRERLRERALGITRYQHAGQGRTLLVPLGTEWWVERVTDGVALGDGLRKLLDRGELEAQLSPDGTRVAYVRDAELYVMDIDSGRELQLTRGAREHGRTHGLAEFVAQEEMKRQLGFWWSPDGQSIAYTEVDDAHIPVWRIPYEGKAVPSWEDHRYPFAGAENAKVTLYVIPAAGGTPVRIDCSAAGEVEYLAQCCWDPDGTLVLQVQDRKQQVLTLLKADPRTGRGRVVLVERSDAFVELHDLYRPLDRGAFLWGSERSGFLHLYVISPSGEARALTSGAWGVDEIVGVDEVQDRVWFLAGADSPLERHLYEIPLSGGTPRRLTSSPGMHQVVMDVARRRFVDIWGNRNQQPQVVLRSLHDGRELLAVHREQDPRAAGLVPPEILELKTRTNEPLYSLLYRPEGTGPFPTVVFVYGGPHVQRVTESWETTVDMRAQHLRTHGIAVIWVDNRGSARRGRAWAQALYGETGRVELEDQVDAVRQLAEQGIVDPAHVGIMGWSYGGYMTLVGMLRAPDVFRVGVAGAPVTHWDGYDTHYTERYMGLPQENPQGYERSSVLGDAGSLQGALMLVHGMLDENVHFRHTGRLVNALVSAHKDFVLQCFPDERHGPRKPADRLYMEERMVAFLKTHL
jgi:dipeptidyl-peptidase-4